MLDFGVKNWSSVKKQREVDVDVRAISMRNHKQMIELRSIQHFYACPQLETKIAGLDRCANKERQEGEAKRSSRRP